VLPPGFRPERAQRRRRAPSYSAAVISILGARSGSQLAALQNLRASLNPFELSRQVDRKLHRIYALARMQQSSTTLSNTKPRRVTFLNVSTRCGGDTSRLGGPEYPFVISRRAMGYPWMLKGKSTSLFWTTRDLLSSIGPGSRACPRPLAQSGRDQFLHSATQGFEPE